MHRLKTRSCSTTPKTTDSRSIAPPMYSNIFLKTLRDGRRSMLLFSLVQFLIGIYLALLFPDVATSFASMIEDLPDFLKSFIGSAEEFATPEGFFTTDPYGVITPLIMVALGINRGASAVAGEEQAHTLDQLLGNPVGRTTVLIHKSLALMVDCLLPTIAVAAALLLGATIMDYSISLSGLFQMSVSLLLLTYAAGFLALGIGAATGSKTLAISVPSVITGVGYLINILVPVVESLSFTRYLSLMHYYIGAKPFIHGITPWHALVLIGIAAVPLIVGVYRFNDRDLRG